MPNGFDKLRLPAFMPANSASPDKAPHDLTTDSFLEKVPELSETYACPRCGGTHRRLKVDR